MTFAIVIAGIRKDGIISRPTTAPLLESKVPALDFDERGWIAIAVVVPIVVLDHGQALLHCRFLQALMCFFRRVFASFCWCFRPSSLAFQSRRSVLTHRLSYLEYPIVSSRKRFCCNNISHFFFKWQSTSQGVLASSSDDWLFFFQANLP